MTIVRTATAIVALATSAGAVCSHGVAHAAGAPPALLNKTISLSWAQTTVQRADDGRIANPTVNHRRTVYVSTQGRIFVRAVRSINNRNFSGTKTGQMAPGDTTGYAGATAAVRFEGSELVGTQTLVSGAGQFRVSFDSAFQSCKVRIVHGRSGGSIRWRGLDGRMYEALSITPSGESCSISNGNAFAE